MVFSHIRKVTGMLIVILLAGCQYNVNSNIKPNENENASSPVSTISTTEKATNIQDNIGKAAAHKTYQLDKKKDTKKMGTTIRMDQITALRLVDVESGWIGGNGWIARTQNEGNAWTIQYQGTGTIQQLFALNGTEVWATISPGNLLLHSTDGGQHWIQVGKVPNNDFIHFISNNEALCGNAKTLDGGKSWVLLPVPSSIVGAAYFHDKNNGWAVTQDKNTIQVIRTKNGGQTWVSVMSRKTQEPINDVQIRSAGKEDAWVELVGGSGMSQTSYSLFHTLDGGENWITVIANSTAGGGSAPGFPIGYTAGPKNSGSKPGALCVVDSRTAFMGGQCMACDNPNTIGWTTDGGESWTNGKQSFNGYGQQLIGMADATHGWWICTDNALPSIMYATTNGGNNWKEVHVFNQR